MWESTGLGELKVSNVPHHSSGKVLGFMPVHCGSNLSKIRTFLVVSEIQMLFHLRTGGFNGNTGWFSLWPECGEKEASMIDVPIPQKCRGNRRSVVGQFSSPSLFFLNTGAKE